MSDALKRLALIPRVQQDTLPLEGYQIKGTIGDVVVGKYADTDEEGNIKRPGATIIIPDDISTQSWRVLEVTLVGPDVKHVKAGDFVVIANSDGLRGVDFHGNKRVFVSEERHVFLVLAPVDNPESSPLEAPLDNEEDALIEG
jgi:hypothetical protein